jgi:putative Mg2+ transporter-C (MgtC) family protein
VSSLPALGWEGALIRLAVAAALGGVIGLERELDEKAAGLRTHILVSLGSALFTLVSAYGFREFIHRGSGASFDPSRIAAQIVTGIGFLGAGVIFRQGMSVRGLTTAASLWVVAAIGMASGAGYWPGAVIATAAALVSLRVLEWVKARVLRGGREQLVVALAEGEDPTEVLAVLERFGTLQSLRRHDESLTLDVVVGRARKGEVLAALAALPAVREASWSR